MSTSPTPEFKSGQYEFNSEQNRTISALADSMGVVATLVKILGLALLIFFGLLLYEAIQRGGGYAGAVGIGAATLFCLAIGFWTGSAAHSFRRIVESTNRDVWHLMNALESLKAMYGLLRTIVIASLVLLAVGFVLWLVGNFSGG